MDNELNLIQHDQDSTLNKNPIDNQWNRFINQEFYRGSSRIEPSASIVNSCPIEHSEDSDVIANYYKIVKKYTLPWNSNIFLETVHKCKLEEIGSFQSAGVGDGRNAAVITYYNTQIGPIFINTNKQAEAICDVVTSLDSDSALGEVSERLLGSEIIQYLKDSIPK